MASMKRYEQSAFRFYGVWVHWQTLQMLADSQEAIDRVTDRRCKFFAHSQRPRQPRNLKTWDLRQCCYFCLGVGRRIVAQKG
jgi:hypothetical protein